MDEHAHFADMVMLALKGLSQGGGGAQVGVDPQRHAAAEAYCVQLRDSPDGWRLCLAKLMEHARTGPVEVRFWCMSVILHHMKTRYYSLREEERAVLRNGVMCYVRDVVPGVPHSAGVKNTLCAILAQFVRFDFPERWPGLFGDFIGLVQTHGVPVADLFVRVLDLVQHEVIDVDECRSRAELEHNTLVKDAMYESVMSDIVAVLHGIASAAILEDPAAVEGGAGDGGGGAGGGGVLNPGTALASSIATVLAASSRPQEQQQLQQQQQQQQQQQPTAELMDLANRSMLVLTMYASWIDIGLVANDSVIPLVYRLLHVPPLQASACKVLGQVVRKGMSPERKLELLVTLQLLENLSSANLQEASIEFSMEVATLLGSYGDTIMGLQAEWDAANSAELQVQVHPMQEQMHNMLEQTLQAVFAFSKHPDFRVCWKTFGFVGEYLRSLKRAQGTARPKRQSMNPHLREAPTSLAEMQMQAQMNDMQQFAQGGGAVGGGGGGTGLSDLQLQHLNLIFQFARQHVRYPQWYRHDYLDDDERLFETFRGELDHIFVKLVECHPELLVSLTSQWCADVLQSLDEVDMQEIEAVLHFIFFFPQISEFRDTCGGWSVAPFEEMIGAIISSKISYHPHPAIATAYFPTIIRYSAYLGTHEQFIGPVLLSLMDQRGMHHPSPQVRSKCCTNFLSLIKKCRGFLVKFQPHIDEVLNGLQSLLQPVLGRVQGINSGEKIVSFDDCLVLCESIGLLVSSPITGDKCREYYGGVIESFRQQLEHGLAQSQAWISTDPMLAGKRFSQVVEAICRVTKELTSDSNRVLDYLRAALNTILKVLSLLPQHDGVRSGVTFFFHRMIECMRDELVPYLEGPLMCLLEGSTSANITSLLDLLAQLARMQGQNVAQLMTTLLMPVVTRVHASLASHMAVIMDPHVDASVVAAHSQEWQAFKDIRSHYYAFLKELFSAGLVPVLTQTQNMQHAGDVLNSVLEGCYDTNDPPAQRTCFIIFQCVVKFYTVPDPSAAPAEALPPIPDALMEFLMQSVLKACLEVPLKPEFDLRDAKFNNVSTFIIGLQHDMLRFGDVYVNTLGNMLLQVGLDQESAENYINVLRTSPSSKFPPLFRNVFGACKA